MDLLLFGVLFLAGGCCMNTWRDHIPSKSAAHLYGYLYKYLFLYNRQDSGGKMGKRTRKRQIVLYPGLLLGGQSERRVEKLG